MTASIFMEKLHKSALRAKYGYAKGYLHGQFIEARRTASKAVRFKLNNVSRPAFDILAFLNECQDEAENKALREAEKSKTLPLFTDEERLNFMAQTSATWHRDKYKLSGCLTWDLVDLNGIEGRNGTAFTKDATFRKTVDRAICEYKRRGGVIRDQSDLYAAQKRSPECVVIYGPQGCGKTLNASKFAAHYGGHCVDADQIGTEDKSVNVVFADSHSSAIRVRDKIKSKYGQEFRVVSFEDALKECGQ